MVEMMPLIWASPPIRKVRVEQVKYFKANSKLSGSNESEGDMPATAAAAADENTPDTTPPL